MPNYLILKETPNAFSHINPGRIWNGNNGMLYLERDLLALLNRHFDCVSTRKTKYGMSYYFKGIDSYSAIARNVY